VIYPFRCPTKFRFYATKRTPNTRFRLTLLVPVCHLVCFPVSFSACSTYLRQSQRDLELIPHVACGREIPARSRPVSLLLQFTRSTDRIGKFFSQNMTCNTFLKYTHLYFDTTTGGTTLNQLNKNPIRHRDIHRFRYTTVELS